MTYCTSIGYTPVSRISRNIWRYTKGIRLEFLGPYCTRGICTRGLAKKNEKKQQKKRVRPNPGKLRRARHPDG
jgi:hypothetical protein